MEVKIHIPDDIAAELQSKGGNVSRRLLEMVSLEGYRSGTLTAYQVQEMLGLETRVDVDGFLKAHGVPLEYSREDLERDRAALKALLGE
jgi:hypothetical protein